MGKRFRHRQRGSRQREIPADGERRRRWLEATAREDPSGYVPHAQRRLDGERTERSEWSLQELFLEITEEAVDIGCWGVLADQTIDIAELDQEQANRLRELLATAVRHAVDAHATALLAAGEISAALSATTPDSKADPPTSRESGS